MSVIKSLKKNRNILYELVRKKVKAQYRNSSLGVIWTVLNPLLNMLVMWLVFSNFFGKGDPMYPLYLLVGNIVFQSLRSSTSESLPSIVNNRSLLLKTKVDPYLFPLSTTLSSIISFGFSLVALLIIMIITSIISGINIFGYQILFSLLILPALLIFEYGISLILSSLYIYFRDIKHFYAVFMTLWMYLTPIFYKINILENNSFGLFFVKLNPMYYFVTFFRDSFYNACYQGMALPNMMNLGISYLWAILLLMVGILFFKSTKKNFITNI